jgi:hypothetical protein
MELGRLIEMCLNEAYNTVSTGKNLYYNFHIQDSLKQDALLELLLTSLSIMQLRRSTKTSVE